LRITYAGIRKVQPNPCLPDDRCLQEFEVKYLIGLLAPVFKKHSSNEKALPVIYNHMVCRPKAKNYTIPEKTMRCLIDTVD